MNDNNDSTNKNDEVDLTDQDKEQDNSIAIEEEHLMPVHPSNFEVDSQRDSQPRDPDSRTHVLTEETQETIGDLSPGTAIAILMQTNQETGKKLEEANKAIQFLEKRCEALIAEKIVLLRSLDTITRLISEQNSKS